LPSTDRFLMTNQIRFNDGAAYERFMGAWSRPAGEQFLAWLDVPSGASWLDVGCGNGAFTERLVELRQPGAVHGIDPSTAQLDYARRRPALAAADLRQGDAMALPWPAASFDVAVMPLVIFFVPEPARGVAEMARVVRPGGIVAAYAWDMAGGGFPYEALIAEMRALAIEVPGPPHPEASRQDVLEGLWRSAGLRNVETSSIAVERTFDDFDDYWTTVQGSASLGATLQALPPEPRAALVAGLQARLSADAQGRITCRGMANAIRGQVVP
jgi:SAM-dependent methyltransferase